MEQSEQEKTDMGLASAHVDSLMEHFDSVVIFATRQDGTRTVSLSLGRGNMYAQYGKVKEWIMQFETDMCRPDSDSD